VISGFSTDIHTEPSPESLQ